MFANATIYRIGSDSESGAAWSFPADLLDRLEKSRFVPCPATQAKSVGWVPPRGHDGGPLAEFVNGHCILELKTQTRNLPGSVVKERVREIAKKIEEDTGRKPGRKQLKELKEQAEHELLPMAFTKNSSTKVWVDAKNALLILDTASQARADEIVTLLVAVFCDPIVGLSLIVTETSPAACMSHWLSEGVGPNNFSVDRECELKSQDEMKSVVRYSRHNLDTDEVRQHIVSGKVPTRLAMTWLSRISLVLTESLQLRKISFLDVVMESTTKAQSKDEGFDADVAIMTEEIGKLIPDLIFALGGELVAGRPVSGGEVAA